MLLLVIIGLFVFAYVDSLPKEVSTTVSKPSPTILINYSNFAQVISMNAIVKKIPKDSTIILNFYNFNTGEREIEKSYIITTGKITEGISDGEIILFMSSKYLSELTNKNFCTVIKKANDNGDLGFESKLSDAALAWKFKSMYEYKSCLGM